MKRICIGDRLVSNRGVAHVVVRRALVRSAYYSDKTYPQLVIQSVNSGRRRHAWLYDVTSWVEYGKWTHIRIPKKIQLPQGI